MESSESMKSTAKKELNNVKSSASESDLNGRAHSFYESALEKTGLNKISKGEYSFTKSIEEQTSKLPSSALLAAGMLSVAASAALKISGRGKDALFVGQWAAPLLLLGIYNKIVKTQGHDKKS